MTHIFAHVTNLQVGTLTHCIGDAHIYKEHVTSLQEQSKLQPFILFLARSCPDGTEKET